MKNIRVNNNKYKAKPELTGREIKELAGVHPIDLLFVVVEGEVHDELVPVDDLKVFEIGEGMEFLTSVPPGSSA